MKHQINAKKNSVQDRIRTHDCYEKVKIVYSENFPMKRLKDSKKKKKKKNKMIKILIFVIFSFNLLISYSKLSSPCLA